MNSIHISGRLTTDIALKQSTNGKSVITFTLAVKRPHTTETVDYIDFVAWEKKAEAISKWCRKGDELLITDGQIEVRTWKDKNDKTRKNVEVKVNEFEFGKKVKGSDPADEKPVPEYTELSPDDDLPF